MVGTHGRHCPLFVLQLQLQGSNLSVLLLQFFSETVNFLVVTIGDPPETPVRCDFHPLKLSHRHQDVIGWMHIAVKRITNPGTSTNTARVRRR